MLLNLCRYFPGSANGKEITCQCKRLKRGEFDPRSERFLGGGHGNSLQYSCLENPMDRRAWWDMSMGLKRIEGN